MASHRTTGDTAAISARFSAAARTYDDYADVQRDSALGVLEMVSSLKPPDRILDIGCGTGVFTAMIADAFPKARIEAIDIAPSLVDVARLHFAEKPNIKCRVADARAFKTRSSFPLVVSNASLHWMEPLEDTFRNLSRLVASDGRLAFSIMLSGTLRELHEARRRVAPRKPPRARLPTRETVLRALKAAGFAPAGTRVSVVTAEYPSAYDFLRAIHHVGVTGGPVSQPVPKSALLTRQELTSLMSDYAVHYSREDRGVWASFEVMYAIASRAG